MDLINDGLLNKTKNNFTLHDGADAVHAKALPKPRNEPGVSLSSSRYKAVDSLSFSKWCSFLAVAVLRTRSDFSRFLLSTMHLPRSSIASTSPAFPLPIPFPGAFAKMPSGFSAARRRRCHFRRAMHVIIMALNFWWCGNSSISLELLRRVPSPSQSRILRRLSNLVLADGPSESFEVVRSGRRFPQLLARLSELSDALTKMGAGAGPYAKIYPGHSVPMDNEQYPELEPYKSLNASRLKVVGEAQFDATDFLGPELCMAYRFPDSLLFQREVDGFEIPQRFDPVHEVAALAKLWDAKGLLHIHDVDLVVSRRFELVRVFNCLKNASVDRQIGDRRGRNAVEMRVTGPSSTLPSGSDILDFYVDAKKESVSIICTDRRDFYHQFETTLNRTMSNSVGPLIPLELLRDCNAFETFVAAKRLKKPSRIYGGDSLGFSERQSFPKCPEGMAMISFKSIFQGDHAGVEIATAAHEGILQSAGLLQEDSRVVAGRPFRGLSLMEGLVIDDYFAIATVPNGLLVETPAQACLRSSKQLYSDMGILGSDDKDICGARKAKVIGAVIDASEQCQSRGHVLVASPAEKRYGMSWLSLQVAQLTHTSDSLHLCLLGGWTSMLMFRRPMMSILNDAFHLVDMEKFDAAVPQMLKLTRKVATELTLLAVLAPLCTSDIAVDFCCDLYATDASLQKGAIIQSHHSRDMMEVLWKCCRSKGGYSKLLSTTQSALARSLDFEEFEMPQQASVRRPLAYRFDFIEVFAGAATVTDQVAALGFSVGCPIDLSYDAELDVSKLFVLEWIVHLVTNHYVKGVMIEPPCTTFSVMRRPALRSREFPFGFDLSDPQTSVGTKLAMIALLILYICDRQGLTAILENPWTSKIKYLPAWKYLVNKKSCQMVRCDSCAYGSAHLKSFLFLCVWAKVEPISDRCDGGHTHVPVEGQYTKKSATYVEGLAIALAKVFANGISRLLDFEAVANSISPSGLESQLVNELSLSSAWQVTSVWTFRVSRHINLLELSSVVRLVSSLVKKGKSGRIVILVDSNVVCCACSKGRSSSKALTRLLVRLATLSVVGGLYVVFGFVPTRLNCADDPTRDVPLRQPIPGMDLATWDRLDLFRLAGLPKLKRWASNWIRLVFCLMGSSALHLCDRSVFPWPRFPYGCATRSSVSVGVGLAAWISMLLWVFLVRDRLLASSALGPSFSFW